MNAPTETRGEKGAEKKDGEAEKVGDGRPGAICGWWYFHVLQCMSKYFKADLIALHCDSQMVKAVAFQA